MWLDMKEGEASIFRPRNRSYGLVAGPDERVVPVVNVAKQSSLCRSERARQSIWS